MIIGISEKVILLTICILAFAIRIFSVLRFESIIHEFDPWFNFRSTQMLIGEGMFAYGNGAIKNSLMSVPFEGWSFLDFANGFYNFHNWYDPHAWYPEGRYVGGSVFPGLMWTAAVFFYILNNIVQYAINLRNTCVFLSPFMASMTAMSTYLFTREIWNRGAGITAAAFIALAGGYVQRSVAGSYDNEAIAIFALITTFYFWVRAINRGTIGAGVLAAIAYAYMVAAWGGYVFLINIIPIHVLAIIVCGRFSYRTYVAYSTFYLVGTLLSMLIVFVSFSPMSINPEHIGAAGVFLIVQLFLLVQYLRSILSPRHMTTLFNTSVVIAIIGATLFAIAAFLGKVPFFTARLLSLLGSSSTSAIVKSVSEHQPSTWTSVFFDLHCIVFLVPVGIFYIMTHLTDANLFALLYVLFASYFTSVMIRIVLVLTPGACALAGIAVNVILTTYTDVLTTPLSKSIDKSTAQPVDFTVIEKIDADDETMPTQPPALRRGNINFIVAAVVLALLGVLFYFFTAHMTHVTSVAYSSPTIILMSQGQHGRVIFDDYREAYSWLNHNTAEDATVLSWWDYGYQIAGMARRRTIVDNNTRNNTQIATAGLILASNEERSYEIMQLYDIDYLLVVFGGRIGYSSDDINKFLWIVRITSGVYPEVVEGNFYTASGQYKIDQEATPTFRNSMMYKMCYYKAREGQLYYDRARNQQIGDWDIKFKYVEEAFTSTNWMIRIYRVKKAVDYPGQFEKMEIQSAIEQANY